MHLQIFQYLEDCLQSIINTHEVFIFFYWEIGDRSAIRAGRAKANKGKKLAIYSTENKQKAIQSIHEWLGEDTKSKARAQYRGGTPYNRKQTIDFLA